MAGEDRRWAWGAASKFAKARNWNFRRRHSICSIIPTITSRTDRRINQLQYNPFGSNCGDGMSLNQTCYLVPNSGPGNFGALQEISPNGLPRVLQFSARFTF
jgi:hypothetical protein